MNSAAPEHVHIQRIERVLAVSDRVTSGGRRVLAERDVRTVDGAVKRVVERALQTAVDVSIKHRLLLTHRRTRQVAYSADVQMIVVAR